MSGMDDQVKRAMARWPAVPAVYGWLRLGRRGTWFLVDRNAPGFDPVRDSGGSPITSPQIIDFIHRNYEADAEGNWYFQNGPQRVYVTLDHAPLIFRVIGEDNALALAAHTGQTVAAIEEACFDRQGNLFLGTDIGPGMIDDRDLVRLMPDDGEPGAPAGSALADGNPADVERAGVEPIGGNTAGGNTVGGDRDVLRLVLPRYGLAIDWDEAKAGQAPSVERIAARLGYRRRPEAPAEAPADGAADDGAADAAEPPQRR